MYLSNEDTGVQAETGDLKRTFPFSSWKDWTMLESEYYKTKNFIQI